MGARRDLLPRPHHLPRQLPPLIRRPLHCRHLVRGAQQAGCRMSRGRLTIELWWVDIPGELGPSSTRRPRPGRTRGELWSGSLQPTCTAEPSCCARTAPSAWATSHRWSTRSVSTTRSCPRLRSQPETPQATRDGARRLWSLGSGCSCQQEAAGILLPALASLTGAPVLALTASAPPAAEGQ